MIIEQDVRDYTKARLKWLTEGQAESRLKADLANLRKGVGKIPGDDPLLWGTFLGNMPEGMYGKNGKPSYAEWAVYTALTLFALHQQGKDIRGECMYQEGSRFGKAMAGLIGNFDEDGDRVTKRFNMVATSSDMEEMAYHLRGVVQLLRGKGIPLDYPDLAGDLYSFQFPDRQERVRLKWGQDFYRVINNQDRMKGEQENE